MSRLKTRAPVSLLLTALLAAIALVLAPDFAVPVAMAQVTTQGAEQPPADGQLLILPSEEYLIRWDEPIGVGPFPINGQSFAELILGIPLFSPIAGLDESLWKKTCSNCHQWNRERLCEQGKSYLGKNERLILRQPHPYGGPEKLALKRWAEQGCL